MSSSGSSSGNNTTLALAATAGVVVLSATAYVSYYITKQSEHYKHQKFQYETYQRDLLIREKTMLARREAGEPPTGTLIDVRIDRVYMWEVQDLRKRFPGTKIENKMRFRAATRSPMLRKAHIINDEDSKVAKNQRQIVIDYNKIITNHECILGGIVRKPNMKMHTVAYVRAGPRKYLHFDPKYVNAAIVVSVISGIHEDCSCIFES